MKKNSWKNRHDNEKQLRNLDYVKNYDFSNYKYFYIFFFV